MILIEDHWQLYFPTLAEFHSASKQFWRMYVHDSTCSFIVRNNDLKNYYKYWHHPIKTIYGFD